MNITWKISNIEWIEELNGHLKVVKNVHYWVECVDENKNMGYTWGNVQLDVSNLANFTDFDTLTEEIVLDWVKTTLASTVADPESENPSTVFSVLENQAINMCNKADPFRKRGIGVPW